MLLLRSFKPAPLSLRRAAHCTHSSCPLSTPPVPSRLCSYAPWCGVCKGIKKEYERAAQLARKLGLPVVFARLDANAHVQFAKEEFGVERLPTFVLFRGHGASSEEFPMLTTAEAYVAGMAKLVGSPLDLTPAKVFDEDPLDVASWIFWRGTSDGKLQTTLLFYDPPREGMSVEAAAAADAAFATFDAVAKDLMRFSNLRFAICRKPDVLAEFEIPTDRHSLVLYKEHDEGRSLYEGPADAAALRAWVLAQDTPLVTDVWHRTLQGFRKRVRTLALLFVREAQFEHYATLQRLKEGLQQVAYALEARGLVRRGEFTIGIADGQKYKEWVKAYGLKTDRLPAIGVEFTPAQKLTALPDFAEEASGGLPEGPEYAGYTLAPLAPRAERLAAAAAATPSEIAANATASAAPADAAAAVSADGSVASATTSPVAGEAPHTAPAQEKLAWVRVPVDALVARFEEYFAAQEAAAAAGAYGADLTGAGAAATGASVGSSEPKRATAPAAAAPAAAPKPASAAA